jgi:hypothetical protein
MAAPTVGPELSIQDRLENLLADAPEPAEENQDSKDTKAKEEAPVIEEPEDETEVVGDEEGEEEPIAAKGEEAPKDEEDSVRTMSDLAKMFEVEEEELLNHLEIDSGDGSSVKLGTVISTYKNAPEAVRRWDELQNQQSAFVAESAQMRERTDVAVRDLASTAQALLDITEEDFKDVNWKELEVEDPQSYLILKNKQAERGALVRNAIDKLRATEQMRLAEMNANTTKTRQAEMSSLHRKMPTWKDTEVASEAMRDTQEYLTANDFTPDEINSISDHRHLLTAWKAAQYDKLKKNAPKKIAKLRGLPKPKGVLRSGARRDSSGDAKKAAAKNFERLRQTGDERDAAKLLEEFL